MANNSSFQQIFQSPTFPKNPSLIEILDYQIKSKKPVNESHCMEIFGELYFKEIPDSSQAFSKNGDGFSSKSSENLQNCTEILGSESTDDYAKESKNGRKVDGKNYEKKEKVIITNETGSKSLLPPLISTLGGNGRPRFFLKSYRHDGRLIIKQFMIPTQDGADDEEEKEI